MAEVGAATHHPVRASRWPRWVRPWADRVVRRVEPVGAPLRSTGPRGAIVFRDPNEDDRVWVLFDWDAEGWQSFVSDPEVLAIFQEAGSKGKPQAAELGGQYDA